MADDDDDNQIRDKPRNAEIEDKKASGLQISNVDAHWLKRYLV